MAKFDEILLNNIPYGIGGLAEVNTDNIADKAVTPEKTSFFEETSNVDVVNVYDQSATNWGYYTTNGTALVAISTSFGVTDYLEIIPNVEITINAYQRGLASKMWFYDADKIMLGEIDLSSNVSSKNIKITITNASAKYLRFNANSTTSDVTYQRTLWQIKEKHIPNLDFNVTKWSGKKVIVDGDSLTSHGSWHSILKTWFGWSTVYNHAMSGGTLTLARAGNDQSGVGQGLKGYERVAQNYESDADVIILMGDSNNLTTNLGTYSDTDESTWCGRMNLMLDAIITKYPAKPLILISNPPRSGTDRSGLGSMADNQAKAMRNLAMNKNLYYIDCYHTNMYRPNIPANVSVYGRSGTDTVHINELGDKMMAEMMYEELKKVGIDFT